MVQPSFDRFEQPFFFSVMNAQFVQFLWVFLCSLAWGFALAPGQIFNLSHWKLQLPIIDPSTGKIQEILQPALTTYNSSFFYADPHSAAMTFWCPESGRTTPGSSFPRTELRELAPGGDWTFLGTHFMNATVRVLQVPPQTGKVAIGQIHTDGSGSCSVIAELMWSRGSVYVSARNSACSAISFSLGSYALGAPVAFSLAIVGKSLYATANQSTAGPYVYTWLNTSTRLYFKQGDYVQEHGPSPTAGGLLQTLALSVTHIT